MHRVLPARTEKSPGRGGVFLSSLGRQQEEQNACEIIKLLVPVLHRFDRNLGFKTLWWRPFDEVAPTTPVSFQSAINSQYAMAI